MNNPPNCFLIWFFLIQETSYGYGNVHNGIVVVGVEVLIKTKKMQKAQERTNISILVLSLKIMEAWKSILIENFSV